MIPEGLELMAPGAELGAVLAELDLGDLSGHDRVVVLRACSRMVSHYQAKVYESMTAVADAVVIESGGNPDDAEAHFEGGAAEIRAALRLTRRSADRDLGLALELQVRFPSLLEALGCGVLDLPRIRVLVDGTCHLSEEEAQQIVGEVLDRAGGWTTGQLRAHVRRLCMEADPGEARARYQQAVEERRVVCEPTEAGTAHLMGLDLPAGEVAAICERIDALAKSLKQAGEGRGLDQLRADVFLDLLGGHLEDCHRGGVELRVDLQTLAGLNDHSGELAGMGPVIADVARQVAETQRKAPWKYTVTDHGRPVASGTTRRRATASQRRAVRDQDCVFPGCRMPASHCDLDHRIPISEGGITTVEQLAPLCRHDHRIRHEQGWTYRPIGGDFIWTSPLGGTYTTSGRSP